MGGTFQRQVRQNDQRFWQLVDCTLTRDQRFWICRRLPRRMRQKSQAVEHLCALPGLTPSQGSRIRALLPEMEHEECGNKSRALIRAAEEAVRFAARQG